MESEYTKEELKELYEQLPDNLKEAVFSTKIGELVREISVENGIKENKYADALKQIGYIFLGILSPDEFRQSVLKDFELTEEQAKSIFARINNEIFLGLKDSLEALYETKIEKIEIVKKEERPITKPVNKKADKYLEPIE